MFVDLSLNDVTAAGSSSDAVSGGACRAFLDGWVLRDGRRTSEVGPWLERLWHEEAERLADRLAGEFALVIVDAMRGGVFAARDLVGTRPLYYRHDPGRRIAFASEIEPLSGLDGSWPVARLDLEALNWAIKWGHGGNVPGSTRTLLDPVRAVPPGHFIWVDARGVRVERWWNPDRIGQRSRVDWRDAAEELRLLLRESVACRVTDRPGRVGVHLSGGLDSTTLAALVRDLVPSSGPAPLAMAWAPSRDWVPESLVETDDGFDERDLIDAAARHADIELAYTNVPGDPALERHAEWFDAALHPRTTLRAEEVASQAAARQGVRTIVSGWGGDEFLVFNGRGHQAHLFARGRWIALIRSLRARQRVMGGSLAQHVLHDVVPPFLPSGWQQLPRKWTGARRPRGARSAQSRHLEFLAPDFRAALTGQPAWTEAGGLRVGARPTQLALLERGHLGRRTASWVQHGRAIGVDYTWPLLDRRIIEFALSLPGEAFLRAGWKRWLFREAVEGLVPDVIRWNRHKRDPALAAQFKRARSERARIEAGRLRDIGEHPLVDVARMAETIQRQGESPTASDPAEAAVARVAFLTTIHPRFTF